MALIKGAQAIPIVYRLSFQALQIDSLSRPLSDRNFESRTDSTTAPLPYLLQSTSPAESERFTRVRPATKQQAWCVLDSIAAQDVQAIVDGLIFCAMRRERQYVGIWGGKHNEWRARASEFARKTAKYKLEQLRSDNRGLSARDSP